MFLKFLYAILTKNLNCNWPTFTSLAVYWKGNCNRSNFLLGNLWFMTLSKQCLHKFLLFGLNPVLKMNRI